MIVATANKEEMITYLNLLYEENERLRQEITRLNQVIKDLQELLERKPAKEAIV